MTAPRAGNEGMSGYLDVFGLDGWTKLADLQFNLPFILSGSQLNYTLPLNSNYLINAGTADMLPALPLQGTMLYFHDMSYHLTLPAWYQYPDQDLMREIYDNATLSVIATHNTTNANTTEVQVPFNIWRRLVVVTLPANVTISDVLVRDSLSIVTPARERLFIPGASLALNTGLDLSPWGSAHGILLGDPYLQVTPSGAGFISFVATNSNGTNSTINFMIYGADMGWASMDIVATYTDLSSYQTVLGHMPLNQPTGLIPLERLIPFATNNPTPATYGSITFGAGFSSNIPNPGNNVEVSGSYFLTASIVTRNTGS